MKNLIKSRSLYVMAVLAATFISMAFIHSFQNDDWVVPEEFENMENPVAADEESLDIGKELYAKHCKSCHGKYGEGDGPKAGELDTDCGDFTSEEFNNQTDGSLFYKSKEGRDDMPTYTKKIPDDEDIWHLVNYMRTFYDE